MHLRQTLHEGISAVVRSEVGDGGAQANHKHLPQISKRQRVHTLKITMAPFSKKNENINHGVEQIGPELLLICEKPSYSISQLHA